MQVGGDFRNFNDEAEIKRLSILSAGKLSAKNPLSNKSKEDLAPPDPYHLTHLVFFFLALGQMIPMTFFTVAQDYWMYKFRDTASDTVDLSNKTMLQKNFVSISGLSHTIPSIMTTLLSSYYGHKINIHTRLVGCYVGLTSIFITYTAFVKINTDTWQLAFFVTTIVVSTGITISSSLLGITTFPMISRFPLSYMKSHMYGGAASGLLSALLQILCLSLGGSSTSVALIYFLCGTGILILSLIFAIVCRYIPRFAYYLGDTEADTKRPTLKLMEMKDIAKKLWPNLVLMVTGLLCSGMGGSTITTLVVSEYYGSGPWADKYFEPVITFLLPDIIGLLGRYFAAPILTPKTAVWYVVADSLRILLTEPLHLFCNALPRKHFPVWFPHDWEYITILSVGAFFRTFFGMSTFMSMGNLLPGQAEQGYLLMASLGGLVGLFHSMMAAFWVNMI